MPNPEKKHEGRELEYEKSLKKKRTVRYMLSGMRVPNICVKLLGQFLNIPNFPYYFSVYGNRAKTDPSARANMHPVTALEFFFL